MRRIALPVFVLMIFSVPLYALADCPIVPQPKEYKDLSASIPLGTSETAAIILSDDPSEPQRYAAERLQTHIQRRFKQTFPILKADQLTDSIVQAFSLSLRADGQPGFNGFTIDYARKEGRDWFSIQGADESGLIYGGEAFFSLIAKDASGTARITASQVRDWPSIPWRGRPHSVMAHQLQPGQLDTYIHGRINFCDYRDDPNVPESLTLPARKSSMGCPPGREIDEPYCKQVLAEYKKRAIFCYGVVSCNLPEGRYESLTETFDRLLALGCDGIWVSMDDTGGGSAPVKLAQFVADYMKKTGMTGQKMAFTPPPAEYVQIDKPLNREMGKIDLFNGGTWFFTRVPCSADLKMAQDIGLKSKPAWWYNYCEVPYPDPKAGFINSAAILTSQRKDGKPAYMNLLPINPGWGAPDFDKIRDAAANTDQVALWAVCGGWPSEYVITMFGQWAWNPEQCDWNRLRDSIYDYVWGPSQVAKIRQFDELYAQLKELYWLPVNWRFRAPENTLVRLRTPENRAAALKLLDQLDALADDLAKSAPEETALDRNRLYDIMIEPMKTSLRFARKQATLEYPEYRYGDFESVAARLLHEQGEPAADRWLAEVSQNVKPMLDKLSAELSELKDIEPVLELWRIRLEKGKSVALLKQSRVKDQQLAWNKLVHLNVSEVLPFMENPLEGNLSALFKNQKREAPAGTVARYDASDWTTGVQWNNNSFLAGAYDRDGQKAAAIVVPRRTNTAPGQYGAVELTVPTPAFEGKLLAEAFLVDSRIDNAYKNVRDIEIWANGALIYRRDIADPKAPDWITLDLTAAAKANKELRIQVVVREKAAVSDHTSWVFVGPVFLKAAQ